MVKIALEIKATLENLAELRPSEPTFRWYLKFVCSNCRELISDKWNYLTEAEEIPAKHGHNVVYHLVSKCKLCLRENTLAIVKKSIKPYTAEDQGEFKPIVVFECKGFEPVEFSPGKGWIAKAKDVHREFTDIDLSEGEWADYCEEISSPVGVYDIEYRFEKVKL